MPADDVSRGIELSELAPLAVVDIDGVVADVRHRLRYVESRPKQWDRFFAAAVDDQPLREGLAVVSRLADGHEVVFLTGRPERCRADTEAWLATHGLAGHRVVMRREGDRRPARQAKRDELRRLARGRTVAVVVDDDPEVCAELTADGWPVLVADWMPRPESLHVAQEREGRT
ncbi:MAG: hypothetical protein ABR520_01265 [Mycobacteriales bacterium]|nr:hypothetical protein [Frankia sp.]